MVYHNISQLISHLFVSLFFAALICLPNTISADDTKTTETLNKWQKLFIDRSALFHAENESLAPDARPIVFAGDSITQQLRMDELFPDHQVLNRGIASDGTANFPKAEPPHYRGLVNRYEDSILDANPRLLFILIGTNDVGMKSIDQSYWEQNLESMIDRVRKDIPDCRIVLQTIPPSGPPYARVATFNAGAKKYNERLKALAERKGLPIIDLWGLFANEEGILPSKYTGDGLHLNRKAHELWAEAARPYFSEQEQAR